jgi:hypothetical protein
LQETGAFILRAFTAPTIAETPDTVLEKMAAGEIGTFGEFEFQLLISMQSKAEHGTEVNRFAELWHKDGRLDRLFQGCAVPWQRRAALLVSQWRASQLVCTFPTQEQLLDALSTEFDTQGAVVSYPSYYLGTRCPVITLRPR